MLFFFKRGKLNSKKLAEMEVSQFIALLFVYFTFTSSYQQLLDPSSNFTNYRRELVIATDKARAEEKCVVPLFSLIIKDLYFENESQPNKLPNGWIKFEVCNS